MRLICVLTAVVILGFPSLGRCQNLARENDKVAEDADSVSPLESNTNPENNNARQLRDLSDEVKQLRASHIDSLFSNVVPSDQFMPPPADPGNLFFNEARLADVNLGAGSRVPGTALIFRAALTGSVQLWYDTGLVASGAQFNPSTIAIGGSGAQGAGVFDMAEFSGKLKFDLNVPLTAEEQAQAFLDTNYIDGEMRVRQAFGRMQFSTVNVLAGKYWTTWGDEGTLPKSLNSNDSFPTGANTTSDVPQLRFALPFESGWVATIAVQKPLSGNVALRGAPDNDVALQRYPDVAGRLRYFDDDFFSVSGGFLVHIIGRENVANDEDFTTGWGLSGATRFRAFERGAVMLGAVGGKGIAGSIFGLAGDTLAASTSATGDLTALSNYGCYSGYQHQWSESLLSTCAYGFAQGDRTFAGSDTTRMTQNAWANVIYKVNNNFALGLQYEYGERELINGDSGVNHRATMIVSITTGQKDKAGGGDSVIPNMAPSASESLSPEMRSSTPRDTGVSKFRRL